MRPSNLAILALLGAGSCAPAATSPLPAADATSAGVAPAAAAATGTVLVVRPIVAAATATGPAETWRALLLDGAVRSPAPAHRPAAPFAEVIVREDEGGTISVVQPDEAGLHPGERVTIGHPDGARGRVSLARL